jgi:hypothetical protein
MKPAAGHPIVLWIFLFVVAPIGAVVLMSALLLFGVSPHFVFAPGRMLMALLEMCGLHVAVRVAVAGTAVFYWMVIAVVGLGWSWVSGRRYRGH